MILDAFLLAADAIARLTALAARAAGRATGEVERLRGIWLVATMPTVAPTLSWEKSLLFAWRSRRDPRPLVKVRRQLESVAREVACRRN